MITKFNLHLTSFHVKRKLRNNKRVQLSPKIYFYLETDLTQK